jgi:AcrR family transcriptional regulator
MCADAGMTLDAVAQALHVTPRTVRYWFSGKTSVPYAAYRLIRILGRFELPDPAWKGWVMHSSRLWSPEGHAFVPSDSNWWGLLCTRARLWTEQYERGRQFDMLMLRTGRRDYAGLEARVRAELDAQAQGAGRPTPPASDAACGTPRTATAVPTGVAGRAAEPPGPNLLLEHFSEWDGEKAGLQRGKPLPANCEQPLTKGGVA